MKPDKKLVARYINRETMGILVMGTALFWPAGRMDWWQAWAALGIMFLWVLATAYIILRYSPEMLAERLGPRRGSKSWDTFIMSIFGLSQLARCIISGLDQRPRLEHRHRSSRPDRRAGGLRLWLLFWSSGRPPSNAFLSHRSSAYNPNAARPSRPGGPYRFVRHPAYIGIILYELAVSILLASWWALIPAGLNLLLIILRTALEDRTLQAELDGLCRIRAAGALQIAAGHLVNQGITEEPCKEIKNYRS